MAAGNKSARYTARREAMVDNQIVARGVRDPLVLDAMRRVPREAFVPPDLQSHAYDDGPLPIEGGQTISQPYIVAFMVEALRLRGGEKVLEIGAGSGYAAAVLAQIASEVFTIERIGQLAAKASHNLETAGVENVHVLHADGTQGWMDEAPFDAILVSAGAPSAPRSLLQQLRVGATMVLPVGTDPRAQELIRITRVSESEFEQEDIADVRFVPLIGKEGWETEEEDELRSRPRVIQTRPAVSLSLPGLIARAGTVFDDVEAADIDPIVARASGSKVVLIGEATHGTSEFYRMRAKITQRLIERHGYRAVAIEGDWPDAARIDHYVRRRDVPAAEWAAFARFPTWMWRNEETKAFVDWLHDHNSARAGEDRTAFYGLDLYSMYTSIREVVAYLEDFDPDLAQIARQRYGCLSPWEADPISYGQASAFRKFRSCERDVAHMLTELLAKRQQLEERDPERFFDAAQNAELVNAAEEYYRTMYYGSRSSWNLRDTHMFQTLRRILDHRGPSAKAVVWAHNSHIGDASATEMGSRGEINIGHLCRKEFGADAYLIGFGTYDGTVMAASNWDGPGEPKRVRPAHPQSFERLFHMTNAPGLFMPLKNAGDDDLETALRAPRLQRAIGVVYRPETELASHYFEARLSDQFDEYIWVDRTSATKPLGTVEIPGLPDTYPFGV